MSLITRCPACGTMFKVVPDQLRISEGWVRCGHCAEVFDAAANMQVEEPAPLTRAETGPNPLQAQHPPQASSLPDAGPLSRPFADDPPSVPTDDFQSSLSSRVSELPPSEPPDSIVMEAEQQALSETPLDRPFVLMRPDIALDEEQAEPATRSASSAAKPMPEPEPEPELHDLSFVREARRRELWRSPGARAFLGLLFLVLAALLAGQVAVHDRDRLSAANPALRPWIARLCEQLHCVIGAPRQIDTLAIESSSFNRGRGETYRLSFTLKNQAPTEVAMPALELTLTDSQDQPVARRVLMPADFTGSPPVLPAASDWSGSVALAINASAGVAGYRLLAFYP